MKRKQFFVLAILLMSLQWCGCITPATPDNGGKEPVVPPDTVKVEPDGGERYVVILSMDAFRHDLPDMYDTPTLDSIASVGVFAEIMPCFPANTFPNHYSMATGLHPDHHGIVNNTFFDKSLYKQYSITNSDARKNPDFYKGEPIWNTVERGGQTAHVYGWVGVEAPIGGKQPTHWVEYSSSRTQRQLCDLVLGALCNDNMDEIPNLTMWYFDEPDAVEHYNTSVSGATKATVESIDANLAYFMREVRRSKVYDKINFIFTSDHGMAEVSPERFYNIYPLIPDKAKYYYNSNPLTIEPADEDVDEVYAILKAHETEGHYQVWRRDEIPEKYHYGTFTDRIQPIVVLAETGWTVVYNKGDWNFSKKATHGYNPYDKDMHMVFYASGPAFKSGYRHDRIFQNLNDYHIICTTLDVEPAPNDCVWDDIEGIFKNQ